MENPKISKKSVHKLWTKVLLPELRQSLASGRDALRQATHDVGAMADQAKSLIEYRIAPIAQQFQEYERQFKTNDTLEMSYLRYQKRWEAIALPCQDNQLLQSGYMYLGRWKMDQMQRVAKGLSVEDPIGFEMLQTASDAMTMFEFRASEPLVAHKANRVVSFPNSLPLIGGILDKTLVPVWSVDTNDNMSDRFIFNHLRTAVLENWDVSGNQGQTVLGTLEELKPEADVPDPGVQSIWFLSASVSGKLIPLPTPLDKYGLPRLHYDTIDWGHVVWSPKAGQYFLVLDTEVHSRTEVGVIAYTTKSINYCHLTPHTESPVAVKTATRPEELSDYTRQVFEDAKRLGDRSVFGAYALGDYEQLKYASEMLKKSWGYEWTPKNMNEYLAAGKPILKNLHEKGAIETANCALANMEFAEAARVFGYKVRLVEGFLGSNENVINAPGHMWTEAYVDGQWIELDVTPVGTQPVKNSLPGALPFIVDMLFQFRNNPSWGSVLKRLTDPHFQSTSDSLMVLAKDMLQIPGEVKSPIEQHTTVVSDRHLFDVNMISSQEMQVRMYELRPDRIATKGAHLVDFTITAKSQPLDWSQVVDALEAFRNQKHLLGILNDDPDHPVYSVQLEKSVELPSVGWDIQRYKATGELSAALQQSNLNELKGELSGNKDDQLVIPGFSNKVFTVCSDLKCVRKEFKLPPKTPDSVVVELLTSLRFITVKAGNQDGETLRYAFSPKAELVLKFDNFNDSDMSDVRFRFGPMGERLLVIPSAVSSDTHHYENMAAKFAALLFAREKGGSIPGEDLHLLKQALHLMLRHPPELKVPLDIVLAAYVVDEARRHHLSEANFVTVTGLPSSQLKACDIMEGCELKQDKVSTSHPEPLSSVNAILLEIAKRVEVGKVGRTKIGFDLATLPQAYRAWFEGFLARNFRKLPQN